MIESLMRKWWLLAFSGLCYAILAVIFLNQASREHARFTAFTFLGNVTLAAGAFTIAAGVLRLRDSRSWLLVLNGVACSVLGLTFSSGTSRPVAFSTIALLLVVMSVSIGIYELAVARSLRRIAGEWFLGAAGVISIGFAFVFLAFILSWIKLEPSSPGQSFHWLGSYFGFSAICALGMACGRWTSD